MYNPRFWVTAASSCSQSPARTRVTTNVSISWRYSLPLISVQLRESSEVSADEDSLPFSPSYPMPFSLSSAFIFSSPHTNPSTTTTRSTTAHPCHCWRYNRKCECRDCEKRLTKKSAITTHPKTVVLEVIKLDMRHNSGDESLIRPIFFCLS